ncbi:MAG TPA: hypothetical protein VEJ18_18925 [Planctomycetota bacterium]|nr:hypothetical protein [Planctomycetota bacterium]
MRPRRRISRGGVAIPLSDTIGTLFTWAIWIGLFVGIGYGIFYAVGRVKTHAEGDAKAAAPPGPLARPKPRPNSSGPVTPPPPPNPVGPQIERVVADLNMAVLAKESARLRGDRDGELERLTDANRLRNRLSQLAAGTDAAPPTHLEPADEITAFEDQDLGRMDAAAAGDFLSRHSRNPAYRTCKVGVKRFGEPRELYVYFGQPPSGAVAAAPASDRVPITNDLALEVQAQVLSLPPDQLRLEERQRIERILGEGEASRPDYEWLIRRMAKDDAGHLFDEKESFQDKIKSLEAMLPVAPVPDAVLTKAGYRVPGKLVSDTATAVTIQTVLLPVSVPKEHVRILYTAKDLREEFARRLKTGLDRTEALPQLLLWTKDWAMPVHHELVAYHMLQINRNDRVARLAAGYYAASEGRWAYRGGIASGKSMETARPERKTEIAPLLETYGFREVKGRWYREQMWSAGIHTLHEPSPFRMSTQGVQIVTWHEADTIQSRLFNPTGKTPPGPSRLRFFAPTAKSGSVTLHVEAPNEILDCQVKAAGAVLEKGHGARIEVYLTPEGGKPTLLYAADAGGNEGWHAVTSLVAGKKRFSVTATMTTTVDKYHTYARFLTSLPDSREVFWVRGTVLQPAPEADKVWASAR